MLAIGLGTVPFHIVWCHPQISSGPDEERELLITAGAELAAAGANHKALSMFGLEWLQRNAWRGSLSRLPELGLPTFTCPSAEELQSNDHLISSLLVNEPSMPQRRLLLCFDRTYVQATTQLLTTTKGCVLAGGVHRCAGFSLETQSQQAVRRESQEEPLTLSRQRDKATEVESCLVLDVTRLHSTSYETAAWPCVPSATKHEKFEELASNPRLQRGQWETLHRIGFVLQNSPSIRFVMSDRHGSHGWLASIMLGRSVPLSDELASLVPFFSSLRFRELPKVKFQVPYRICIYGEDAVHFVPGSAHAQKALAEQLRTCLRTPMFGLLWSDLSGGLDLGLNPASYCGTDGMSDAQAALLCLALICWEGRQNSEFIILTY